MLRTRLNLMTFAAVLATPLTAGQIAHGAQAPGGGAAPGLF